MSFTTDLDAIFSDESSFYGQSQRSTPKPSQLTLAGDEDEQARLEELAATYDPEPYWSEEHPRLFSTIQYELLAPAKPSASQVEIDTTSDSLPPDRRGPTESIFHFLSRLPPSTTSIRTAGPWICMRDGHNKSTMKEEEEDTETLVRRGTSLLRDLEEESAQLRFAHEQSSARTTAPLTRKLNALRRTLEKDISSLAQETNVVSGKWMLFPTVDRVDAYWSAVVGAVDKGELGPVAKVATSEGDENGRSRLICVYTRDFEDKEDVKRVLMGLVNLGLVKEAERPIYYKCDAYTHLDIKSGNPFGLKASLFSSRDVLDGTV